MELFLKVPVTKTTQTIDTLLQMAGPWLTVPQRKRICKHGVEIDETPITKSTHELEPESILKCDIPDPLPDFDMYECPELMRNDGISVIEKLVSMPGKLDETPFDPLLYVADGLGLDRNEFKLVWDSEFMHGGPWLLAEDQAHAEQFRKEIASGEVVLTWVVLVPAAHHSQIRYGGLTLDVALSKKVGEICELQLTPSLDVDRIHNLPNEILEALAVEGIPVIGDVERGGFANPGGVKIRLLAMYRSDGKLSASWNPPTEWWPKETVVPLKEKPKLTKNERILSSVSLKEFIVSDLSMKYINEGHPWVTRDKDTDRGKYEAGTFVTLKTQKGVLGPVAILSNEDPVVARFWGEAFQNEAELEEEILFRLDEALAARDQCFSDVVNTDTFRLIHGENDAFPGITVDRFGPVLRTTVRSKGVFSGFSKAFYDKLREVDTEAMIIEASHGKDIRKENQLPQVRVVAHGTQQLKKGDRHIIRELGLKYWVELWEGIDVGFFCDQRENRRMLENFATAGEKWLNLFSHTGAFSVKLGALGVSTVNVDLSRRYLDWFVENLELNKLDTETHSCHAVDAREFLKQTEDMYSGIIVDPPTASSGDGGFWSVKRDYEALIRQCANRLLPGGTMLICRNERAAKVGTKELVKKITTQMGRKARFTDAAEGADFPVNASFPEGTTFDGVWVTLD